MDATSESADGGVDAPRRSPTARDVAHRAGVSQSTVSLVLAGKGKGRVSPETQQHVRRVVEGMGYRPNAAAQTLRLGRARNLALVIPDVENPYFASVLLGAERAARVADYSVILVDERESPTWSATVADGVRSGAFAGSILYAPEDDDIRVVSGAADRLVVIEARAPGVANVELDIEGGVRAAMNHLLELGHRHIAHVAADYPKESFRVRHRVWLDALAQAGLTPGPEVYARWDLESAREAVAGILSGTDRPTAVLCDDDLLAAAVYRAARARGLRIPADLSVTGFTDNLVARLLDPELTTIAIPAEAVGRSATELLLDQLRSPLGTPSGTVTLPLELRIRESTAPSRR